MPSREGITTSTYLLMICRCSDYNVVLVDLSWWLYVDVDEIAKQLSVISYDTIEEFNVDSKAKYTA